MRRRLGLILLLGAALAAAAIGGGGSASAGGGGFALQRIAGFDQPVYVTGAPGFPQLLFVVEKTGRIEVVRSGRKLRRSFLNIAGLVNSLSDERGLLSVAFPPDYKRTKRFYVYYTDSEGDIRVDEFRRRTAVVAARGSRRTVMQIPHRTNSNHNGGQLQFLGRLLYIGSGDGGSGDDPPDNAKNKGGCSESCCESIRATPADGATTGCRARTRSSGAAAATRSSATGSATHGASPSTRSTAGGRGS